MVLNGWKQLISLSICAGFSIGLGCMAFLLSPTKLVGSVLFSVGLVCVVVHQLRLFTGTICSVKWTMGDALRQAIILTGNLLGAVLAAGVFLNTPIGTEVAALVAGKVSASYIGVFCKAVLCNVLICLAVDEWKSQGNTMMVVLAVTVFVLCGFEHCIANTFYMVAAQNFVWDFLLVNILGNMVGGIAFWRLKHIAR